MWSQQVDGYVVVSDPFIPPAQRPTASFLDDGLSVVFAQQARAAKAVDTLQVATYLRFEVTLVVVGCGLRCPPVPYPRDHLPSLR
jgi:hypothetical protein